MDSNYGGQRIGSKILEESERSAKEYGFTRGTLGATLSGVDFYKAKGWESLEYEYAPLPDGVVISVLQMSKVL